MCRTTTSVEVCLDCSFKTTNVAIIHSCGKDKDACDATYLEEVRTLEQRDVHIELTVG